MGTWRRGVGSWWADPLTAIAIARARRREGLEGRRGDSCDDAPDP